ncbi:unnamed protein product, partial [marine sediment metagenome]
QAPHMRELLSQVVARLVRHELYVARFYLLRDNYDAAVARIQYALRNYGAAIEGSAAIATGARELEAEALLLLGTTYLKMQKLADARQTFQTILKDFPTSAFAVPALNYLEYLKRQG